MQLQLHWSSVEAASLPCHSVQCGQHLPAAVATATASAAPAALLPRLPRRRARRGQRAVPRWRQPAAAAWRPGRQRPMAASGRPARARSTLPAADDTIGLHTMTHGCRVEKQRQTELQRQGRKQSLLSSSLKAELLWCSARMASTASRARATKPARGPAGAGGGNSRRS